MRKIQISARYDKNKNLSIFIKKKKAVPSSNELTAPITAWTIKGCIWELKSIVLDRE